MSSLANLAPVRRLRRTRPPRLRLLAPTPDTAAATRRAAIGRGAFIAVVGALVVGGMAMLLVLNTTLAQGAFDLQQLRGEHSALQVQEQQLAQQVELAQSPEALKAEAVRLGMVPVQVPAFLRLSDGEVLGEPTPAKARVTRESKLARGATGTTEGAGDAASPDPSTDAATPSGGGQARTAAATTGQSDGAEAAEDAAARDGRHGRDRGNRTGDGATDDGAVAGPEGAEDAAPPAAGGTGAG